MLVLAAGFLIVDIIAADLPSVAEPGEVVFAEGGIEVHLGGHPANLSVNLVKLGIPGSELGVVGAVGDDVFGTFVERSLRGYGIRAFLFKDPSRRTAKNLILVVKGEDRRFHVDPGANEALEPRHVIKGLRGLKPRLFYMAAGLTKLVDRELDALLGEAKRLGALTFLDLIKPDKAVRDRIRDSLKYVDIIHCNAEEAKYISGESELEQATRRLSKLGAEVVLVTLGGKGAYLHIQGMRVYQPAFRVEVIDPTGAGDAFCAGFLKKLYELNGLSRLPPPDIRSLSELLLYAQAVGAVKCTGVGTTSAVDGEAVARLIESQGSDVLRRQEISATS